jgi:hypothetical protein
VHGEWKGNTVSFSTKEALAELEATLGDNSRGGRNGASVISTGSPDTFPLRNQSPDRVAFGLVEGGTKDYLGIVRSALPEQTGNTVDDAISYCDSVAAPEEHRNRHSSNACHAAATATTKATSSANV